MPFFSSLPREVKPVGSRWRKKLAVGFGRWRTKDYCFGSDGFHDGFVIELGSDYLHPAGFACSVGCVAKYGLRHAIFSRCIATALCWSAPFDTCRLFSPQRTKTTQSYIANPISLLWRPHQGAVRVVSFRIAPTNAHIVFCECASVCFLFALSKSRIVICCRLLFPVVNWELVAVSHASSDVVQWRGADRRTCRACLWACGCAGAIRWLRMKMMILHFKYSDSLC